MLKLLLLVNLAIFGGFGLSFLVAPGPMAASVGLLATTTTALSDIRATYGGMELGFVAVVMWLWRRFGRHQAQVAVTFVLAGFMVCRGIGLLLDTPATNMTLSLWAIEVVMTAVNAAACRRADA